MTPFAFQSPVTNLQPVSAIVETQARQSYAHSVSRSSDNDWRAVLGKMVKPNGQFEMAHVRAAIFVWESLSQAAPQELALPLTQVTAEGSIQLAWDAGRFYLEVDIRKDLKLEWFFRDRQTNELDGTDDEPESGVSGELISRLWYICIS